MTWECALRKIIPVLNISREIIIIAGWKVYCEIWLTVLVLLTLKHIYCVYWFIIINLMSNFYRKIDKTKHLCRVIKLVNINKFNTVIYYWINIGDGEILQTFTDQKRYFILHLLCYFWYFNWNDLVFTIQG